MLLGLFGWGELMPGADAVVVLATGLVRDCVNVSADVRKLLWGPICGPIGQPLESPNKLFNELFAFLLLGDKLIVWFWGSINCLSKGLMGKVMGVLIEVLAGVFAEISMGVLEDALAGKLEDVLMGTWGVMVIIFSGSSFLVLFDNSSDVILISL